MKSSIVARWLAYPVVFVAILLLFSVTDRDWVPNVAPFSTLSHSSTNKAVSDGVIAVDGIYAAFTLGKLYALAQSKCSDESPLEECLKLHEELKHITRIQGVTFQDLDRLKLYDSSQTVLQRAASYVTLANVVFIVGFCFAAIAIIPLFMKFIIPLFPYFATIAIALMPFYEIVVYSSAGVIISQSQFYESSIAWLVAFSGCIVALVGFAVSTLLHVESDGGREEEFIVIFGSYMFSVFAIVTLIHQTTSSFLGFFACVGGVSALGFTVIPIGLGYLIGFRSRYGCQRFAITSLLIMIATIIVLVFFPRWWPILAPFKFGIFSLCGSGYFLATLIICSRHYSDDDDLEFWAAQLMFLIPLICLFTVGITHNIQALSNAAGIFFVLYCIEKYVELAQRLKGGFWLMMFIGGCAMVYVAFYLRTHSEIIMTIVEAFHN